MRAGTLIHHTCRLLQTELPKRPNQWYRLHIGRVFKKPFFHIDARYISIPLALALLAGRGTSWGRVAAVALICALGRLDVTVLVLTVVAIVGVECRARVLRLLLLAVRGRGRRRAVATVVRLVTSVVGTLVTVVVHLLVVVVLAPWLTSHPACAVYGLMATALAAAGDTWAC